MPVAKWPKLAWVAVCARGSREILLLHGPAVERGEGFACEAVWAGPFAEGGFDRTGLTFVSGVRLRGGRAVFVGSGSRYDRLWHTERTDRALVSNSLPALLAVAGDGLLDTHDYVTDMRSARFGLHATVRNLPTTEGEVTLTYFHNQFWDGDRLREEPKPLDVDGFAHFAEYQDFLRTAAERIGANAADPHRNHSANVLASVSSGYDSGVAAWAARHMGATRAVTIGQSNSLWRGADSGEAVAGPLGLTCETYGLRQDLYPNEEAVWASCGMALEINWTQFRFGQPVCVFASGCHGDAAWAIDGPTENPFASPSLAGSGLTEWRLLAGVLHCPVPVWGLQSIADLRGISRSEEMRPWTLGSDYDRPIARRILETEGVPRNAFGLRKKNTQITAELHWPFSPDAQISYAAWRERKGLPVVGRSKANLYRRLSLVDRLIRANVLARAGIGRKRTRPWDRISNASHIFRWANDVLRRRYAEGLRQADVEVGA